MLLGERIRNWFTLVSLSFPCSPSGWPGKKMQRSTPLRPTATAAPPAPATTSFSRQTRWHESVPTALWLLDLTFLSGWCSHLLTLIAICHTSFGPGGRPATPVPHSTLQDKAASSTSFRLHLQGFVLVTCRRVPRLGERDQGAGPGSGIMDATEHF